MSDKCLQCKVRGDCCYVNVPIEGYNIILNNVYCPKLDNNTGLCSDYENRHQYSWCLDDGEMFEKGCLPKGCEYLKNGHSEQSLKIQLGVILNDPTIDEKLKRKIMMDWQFFDRIPFEKYIEHLYKKEEAKV